MPDDVVEMRLRSGLNRPTASPMAFIVPINKNSPLGERHLPVQAVDPTDAGQSQGSVTAFIRRLAGRLSEATSHGGLLAEAVGLVASAVKCDACFIYAVQGDDLVLVAFKNLHSGTVNRVKLKSIPEFAGQPVVVARGAPMDARFEPFNKLSGERLEALLSVPLVSRGHLVGIVHVQNREPYRYTEGEIGLVSTVGFLVGAAIDMARLEQQNAELAERLRVRTLVERAKGLLQSDLGITEREAYQKLQRQSQQMRRSMKDIAEAVVLSHTVRCAKPD